MDDYCSHAALLIVVMMGLENVRYLWLFELINLITAYL